MVQNLPEDFAQINAQDLKAQLNDVVILDVRTAEEIEANGAFEGAIHIPLNELLARQDEWPAPNARIITVCSSGYRGNMAMTILRAHGYTNVQNLRNGFAAWQEAGFAGDGEGE
ncbi:MAG TPA: rhodanese-like domain-containing protein [Aggregatilineales bacterium]|nr:rhodanese-like domain-containing protein [Aggregatilineales bacterium]